MLHPWMLWSRTQLSLTANIEQIKNPKRQRFIDSLARRLSRIRLIRFFGTAALGASAIDYATGARAFALARFAFWIQMAQLSASFRLVRRIEDCDSNDPTPHQSAVGFINSLDLLFEKPAECQTNHDAQSDSIGCPSTVGKSLAYVIPLYRR